MGPILFFLLAVVAAVAGAALCAFRISGNEVGLLSKKRAPFHAPLPPGRLIAVNGEAGYQARTLAPGLHFLPPLLYEVRRVPLVSVPSGQIGLIYANDGVALPPGHNVGRVVPCANFEDGAAFLRNGGQKGPQLDVLKPGTHRINTQMFKVITAANAEQEGLDPADLQPHIISATELGIVTALEGRGLPDGMRVAPDVDGHKCFQDPQRFLDADGYMGLQEKVLPPGRYTVNPWFAKVAHAGQTEIPAGTVGVVISDAGDAPFHKEGSHALVEKGQRGVWREVLQAGIHLLNTEAMRIELVPTNQIILDWSNKPKPATNYDAQLDALRLRSQDGFEFCVEVTQGIQINAADAPRMISRIGATTNLAPGALGHLPDQKYNAIHNLVTRELGPLVGSYFRKAAQGYNALAFHEQRAEREREASDFISTALDRVGVQATGTYINEVDLPDRLEKILTESTESEKQVDLYKKKRDAEQAKQEWVRIIAEAEHEPKRVAAGVEAERYRQLIDAFGGVAAFLEYLRIQVLPQVKWPVYMAGGGQMTEALLAQMLPGVSGSDPGNEAILEWLQSHQDDQSTQAIRMQLKHFTEEPGRQVEGNDLFAALLAKMLQGHRPRPVEASTREEDPSADNGLGAAQ